MIATVMVWLPVILAIVFGGRAQHWMADVQSWLAAHKRALTVSPVVVPDLLETGDALIALAS